MQLYRKYNILVLLFLFTAGVSAQDFSIETLVDTNYIVIGDQIHYKIKITKNKHVDVEFPSPKQTLSDDIEVISYEGIDTVILGDKDILTQTYLVSVYDSGVFYIEPQNVVLKMPDFTDTVQTPREMIVSSFVPVDMEKGVYDIKAQYDAPLTFIEVLPYAGGGLLFIILLLLLIVYLRRKKQNKPLINLAKPKDPPHIIAYKALDDLKNKKLWQQGLYKQYYSGLSDILRTYFEERFQFPAMEMVSYEIIDYVKEHQLLNDSLEEQLIKMLESADLAKFAKASPLPDENQQNFDFVYTLVDRTKATSNNNSELNNVQLKNEQLNE